MNWEGQVKKRLVGTALVRSILTLSRSSRIVSVAATKRMIYLAFQKENLEVFN